MKRFFLTWVVLFATLAMSAQDEVLRKYTENDDVNTIYVSKGMLEQVPIDQFNVPGLTEMASRIEHMTILVSRGDKAGKEMGTKLPKQLMSEGFEERYSGDQPDPSDPTGKKRLHVRMLQSEKDPSRVVMVMYDKPHATVVSMKGDFITVPVHTLLPEQIHF